MGGHSTHGGSKSSSRTYVFETELSKTQSDVLKKHEELFQSYYLPEFKDLYESMTPDSEAGKAQMGLVANQINQSFDSSQKQTNQAMAQHGITGSGAHLATLASNNRARSSALANAYAQQMANSTANKASALANLGSMMPQTTTAAPVVTSNASQATSWNFGMGGGVTHS